MTSVLRFFLFTIAPLIVIAFVFSGSQEALAGGLIIYSLFYVYLFPWIVALSRTHPNSNSILAINLFLGWTLVGWVVALVWGLFRATS